MKRISLGSDHAGWKLKQVIKEYLHSKTGLDRLEINDWGCYSEERCDYPDFAHKVAEDVENKKCDFGILICGSGNGINMTANKWSGVRSALCWESEISHMARLHNDANIYKVYKKYEENCSQVYRTYYIFTKTLQVYTFYKTFQTIQIFTELYTKPKALINSAKFNNNFTKL